MIAVQGVQRLHRAYETSPIYANGRLRFAYNGRGSIGDCLKTFPQAETTLRTAGSISKLNLLAFKNAEKICQICQYSNPAYIIDDVKFWFRGTIGERVYTGLYYK